jgi:kynureninase
VTVWDLSHAAGAVELDVAAAGVDLAVGCTYKFLHGGPGAPAWSYVRPGVAVEQPIWGWFAQREQFEMGDAYEPHTDVRRLLLGTPGILGLAAAEVGIGHVADAGMAAVAAKGRALTALALALCDELGLDSPTPRDGAGRGAHVAVRVADADAVHAALAARGVVTDVRRPDIVRLGCAALTTRFSDVWDGVHAVAESTGRGGGCVSP